MDYDPFLHREIANLTYFDAVMNMLKCIFGTGILAMPIAFKNVGWLSGFIGTAIICGIMTYAIHILIRGMTEVARRHEVGYLPFDEAMYKGFLEGPESMFKFRQVAKYFVLVFLLGFYFGTGSAYMIFLAESTNKMLGIYASKMDIRVIIFLEILPLFAIFMVRNLKALVPFSSLANVCLFSALFAILYFIVRDLPPLSERRPFNEITGIPIFFGIALFASCSIGVFLSVESQMVQPIQYISPLGVLNFSMIMNYISLSLFAFLGYWQYGDAVKVSITLNVGEDSVLSQVVTILYSIAIYITYSVQCSVIIDILWTNGMKNRYPPEKQFSRETILRLLIIITTTILAIALPKFDLVIGLAGCVTLTILAISFPGALDMCLRYKSGNYGPLRIYFIRDLLLIIFGVAFCILGIVSSFFY